MAAVVAETSTNGHRATPRPIDFGLIDEHRTPLPHRPQRRTGGSRLSMSKKQLRARARRDSRKAGEALALMGRPIEEWDDEELARGRPRAADGTFKGRAPEWISREVHENAVERFRQIVRDKMNSHTVQALQVLGSLLDSEEFDEKGKPLVPASTKAEIAKWMVEHVLGKPTQRMEQDISVRLQAVLASSTMMPGSAVMPAALGAADQASPRSEDDLDIVDAEWSE